MELEVGGIGDIDLIIKEEEILTVGRPTWEQGVELGGCDWIRGDVGTELLDVHDNCGTL